MMSVYRLSVITIHFLLAIRLGVGGVTARERGDTVTDSLMLTSALPSSVSKFMICTKHILYQVKQGLKTLLFSGY